MSFAASTASVTVRSPSRHESRRTEKTTSQDFFAPVKAELIMLINETETLKGYVNHNKGLIMYNLHFRDVNQPK